jgi:hypothetical protein
MKSLQPVKAEKAHPPTISPIKVQQYEIEQNNNNNYQYIYPLTLR